MGLFDKRISELRDSYEAKDFIESLTEYEMMLLIRDWIAQIWLYENEPPTTNKELDNYGIFLFGLYDEFKDSFINGDYKRITPGIGHSIEESVLIRQMETNMLHVSLLSDTIEIQTELILLKKIPFPILLQSFCLFLLNNSFDEKNPENSGWYCPTYVIDGDLCHYIHVRGISKDFEYFYYDELWWKGTRGLSFFTNGENSLNTNAELINADFNTFKVSHFDFMRFFKGWEMPRSGLPKLYTIVKTLLPQITETFPSLKEYRPENLLNYN